VSRGETGTLRHFNGAKWVSIARVIFVESRSFLMDRERKVLLSAITGIVVMFSCVSNLKAEETYAARFIGSRYVYFTITDLAKVYMDRHPAASVLAGYSDYHAMVDAIVDKTRDAIMVLGKLEDDMKEEALERGILLQEHAVGWGGVALVTDPGNPVEELTLDQIRKIFLGEYVNWREVGGLDEPIVPMSRDEQVSGTERFFRESVLDGRPFTQMTVRLFDPDIVRAVWKRKGAIADARYTEAVRGRIRGMVKIIAIKEDENSPAVMPSVDNLRNEVYPLTAPMFVYYDSTSFGNVLRDFANFCSRRGLGFQYADATKRYR
jgi:phosphate transport system substrate-binding protein